MLPKAPPSHPVQVAAPDIGRWRHGNTGIDYVTTLGGTAPGPHVMVSAAVHGNELCGAIVVDELLAAGISPRRGRLTLAFMNVAALQAFDAAHPDASRWVDEDFNRLWTRDTLEGTRDSVELARARALRPLVDEVDFLLDLHSMTNPSPPLILCGATAKGQALARALGYPRHVVADAGHAAGRRLRDYDAFAEPASPRNALLVECGRHWSPDSVAVAREATLRFLALFHMLDTRFLAKHLPPAPRAQQQVVEVTAAVTVTAEEFRFAREFEGMEVLESAGTLIGHDGEREVRTPHDRCVIIMPSPRLWRGQTAVRLGRLIGT